MKFSARAGLPKEALNPMKKPIIWTIILLQLVLIALIPAVMADQGNSNAGTVNSTGAVLKELPELDMIGMHTDIELIEIDPEIVNSTEDWMVLAHDDVGKKLLIDDIDSSDLTAAGKNDAKNAVRKLWDTYPTKFEDAGEKSIDIVVTSNGSNRTVSVPIGHVTRITFDKEKIRQTSKDNKNTRLMKAVQIGQQSAIILNNTENLTVKNITNLRSKKSKAIPESNRNPSSGGSYPASGSPENSFSSGFPSSSSFTSESGFSSSSGKREGESGTGLIAWAGSHSTTYSPPGNTIPSDKNLYNGHNSFAYWGATYMNLPTASRDVAAFAGLEPDFWNPVPDPTGILNQLIHSINHYYNPDASDPIHHIVPGLSDFEGQAPDEFATYAGQAHVAADICRTSSCTQAQFDDLAKKFGWADHFLTDVGNPLHTGREVNQVADKIAGPGTDTHTLYENYVYSNWLSTYYFGNLVSSNDVYYPMTDPTQSAKNLATFSHAYVDTLYYRVRNNPSGFSSDDTVRMITENCIRASARYTNGFAYYCKIVNTNKQRPAADFRYVVNSYDATSASITFTDTSIGTVTSRQWSFPGGSPSSSTVSPVTVSFAPAGMKRVTLTVSNQYGPDSKTVDVPVGRAPPIASFNTVRQQYSTIQFISTSIGENPESNPTIWNWNFGDGFFTGDTSNPIVSHSYPGHSPVPYQATLVVKNIYGNSVITQDVNVPSPAEILFTYIQNQKIVSFIDQSTSASTWNWNFGDIGSGNTSTERNPTHTYSESGNYMVQLKIQDSNWMDQKVLTQQITISDTFPLANFTATPTSGLAPLTVRFTDTSTGSPTSRIWDFGDGNTTDATAQNPVHTYWLKRSFNVSLTVYKTGAPSNTTMKVRYIKVTNMTDSGVYRSGQWILDYGIDGTVDRRFYYGLPNDTPVVSDFNNDGTTDIGVFRSGQWILDYGIDGTVDRRFYYGLPNDTPVVSDFNNDGTTDIGVFRSGQWILDYGIDGIVDRRFNYGVPNDTPVVGDFNNWR
jgi:PKD repeat protein